MKNLLSGAALAVAFVASPVAAQSITVSTGVDYSEGDFGTDTDTSVLVVPLSVRSTWDKFSISASIPYLEIDGSSSVVGGSAGPIVIDPTAPAAKRSGIGDLSIRLRYEVLDLGGAALSVNGRTKIPTGSRTKGLSTGEFDYSGGFELAATTGVIQPFAEIGYRVLGDPDGIELENGFYGSIGTSVLMGGGVVGIASYDYVASSVNTIEDTHSLFAGIVLPVSNMLSLTGYGTAGLSDSAADYGVGLLLSLKLNN